MEHKPRTDIQKRIAGRVNNDGTIRDGYHNELAEMLGSGKATPDDFIAVAGTELLQRITLTVQAWGRMHRTAPPPEPKPIQEYAADIVAVFEERDRLREEVANAEAYLIMVIAHAGGIVDPRLDFNRDDVKAAAKAGRICYALGGGISVMERDGGHWQSKPVDINRLKEIIEEIKA